MEESGFAERCHQDTDGELERLFAELDEVIDWDAAGDTGLTVKEYATMKGLPRKKASELLNEAVNEGKVVKGKGRRWSDARPGWYPVDVYWVKKENDE